MENHHAARPDLVGEALEHGGRLLLELQHITAHDRIECGVEAQFRRVAFGKRHVPQRPCRRSRPHHLQRGGNPVGADDRATGANHLRGQEGDITSTAAHIEHSHVGAYAGRPKEAFGDRVDQARLGFESRHFVFGMPQQVRVAETRGFRGTVHGSHSEAIGKGDTF